MGFRLVPISATVKVSKTLNDHNTLLYPT